MPKHADGIFAVGDGRDIVDRNAVGGISHNKESVVRIIEHNIGGSTHAGLCLAGKVIGKVQLPEDVIRNTVLKQVAGIEVIDQHAVIVRIRYKKPVICGVHCNATRC